MLCCSAHKIYLLCSRIIVLSLLLLNKSLLYSRQFRVTVLLGCIYNGSVGSLRQVKAYQSYAFVAIFKHISYYAGIMLNAFSDLLCSKLCWHILYNRLVPNV